MSFANPEVFYALILLPLLVLIFILSERGRRELVGTMVGAAKPEQVMGAGFERRLLYLIFLCLGVGLLVTAAARPQWGTRLETVRSRGIDILLAVDVSESMRATDVSPDRISKARQEVEKFLDLLEGDRVGLIAFSGSAYTYCPLTVDYAAIRLFLSGLEPGVISDSGTDVGEAIREAIKTYERSDSNARKVLVIFSDGEHHESDPLPAVAEAREKDIQIYTIGVGNPDRSGERIPVVDDSGEIRYDEHGNILYKKNQEDQLIITQLDEATLRAIADQGEGEYYRVSEMGIELVQIYRKLAAQEETEFSSRRHHQKVDRFQFPLLAAILFLALAYSLGDRSFKKLRRTQGVIS